MNSRDQLNLCIASLNTLYDVERAASKKSGTASRLTVAIFERRHGLEPGQLKNFRANTPRRTTPLPEEIA